MKYLKRVLSLALCLLMLVSSLPVAAFAAAGQTNLVYAFSEDTVEEGDEFTVTIGNKAMEVASIAFGLNYDKTKLEVTKITETPVLMYMGRIEGVGETTLYATPTAVSSVQDAEKNGYVGVTFASTVEKNYLERNSVLTVTFKVKTGAAGTAAISFFENSDGNDGYTNIENNNVFVTEHVTISTSTDCKHPTDKQIVAYYEPVPNEPGKHTKYLTCDRNKGGCGVTRATTTESCSGGSATCLALAECDLCGEKYGTKADHVYVAIPAKAEVHTQTELSAAVKAHYQCSVCQKLFTEPNAETNLDELTGEIPEHNEDEKKKGEHKRHLY